MLTETDHTTSWAPVAILALAATAIGGFLYLRVPLESQRPEDPSTVLDSRRHHEFPLARMWQDPLHAIHTHWDAVPDPTRMLPDITEFARKVVQRGDEKVLRLLVMVPGTPYSNDRETRRRQRHAVVSALTDQDFVPTDEARLRYFHAPRFASAGSTAALDPAHREAPRGRNEERDYFPAPRVSPSSTPSPARATSFPDRMLVGYEEFRPAIEADGRAEEAVQVLWLNSDDFDRHLLDRLSAVVAILEAGCNNRPTTTNVLLGPVESAGLKGMFDDASSPSTAIREFMKEALGIQPRARGWLHSVEDRQRRARESIRILSPRATVPLDLLACSRADPTCRETLNPESTDVTSASVEKYVAQRLKVASFHSTVADDRLVLSAVLDELIDRDACRTAGNRPRIAIVSEQDSVYGRVLDDIAQEVALNIDPPTAQPCGVTITEHGYLRGVDGETRRGGTPGTDDARVATADDRARGSTSPFALAGHREPPFGVAQLDYVRRLSEQIVSGRSARPGPGPSAADAIREGQEAGAAGSLVAIGVLGHDIYDKLLILQALRESRSEVVFFTTDLDARLLDPEVYEWTRNIIVGSSFDLSLESDREITFRDSYQAALFVAVRQSLALGQEAATDNAVGGAGERDLPRARLFEVGRDRVVDLHRKGARGDRSEAETLVLVTPLLGLALFAFIMKARLPRQRAATRRRWYTAVTVGALASAGALYLFLIALLEREPWPFFQGVSSVPTVALHVTTIVFSLAVVALAHGRTRHGQEHVAGQLGGAAATGDWGRIADSIRAWWATLSDAGGQGTLRRALQGVRTTAGLLWIASRGTLVSTWRSKLPGTDEPGQTKDGSELWTEFQDYNRWWRRLARISVGVAIGLSLRELYFSSVRAQQPLLGQHGMTPAWVEAMLPFLLFVAIFYCRDTLNVWQTFIRALTRYNVTTKDLPKKPGNPDAAHGRWTVDLLVRSTELVGPVVVFPLVLMVLLILARSTLFEGWNWTTPLLAFHIGLVSYILFIAISFQLEASEAKNHVLDRMRVQRGYADEQGARAIESVIEYIQTRRRGAFVPWTQHPILQTLALPIGSVALITVLENWLGR